MLRQPNLWSWLIRHLLRCRRTVVAVVFLVGVLLTAGSFLGEWNDMHKQLAEGFRSNASEHFGDLKEEVEEAVKRASSVADLFQTIGDVDRDHFREFVVAHLTHAPGLLAVGWAPRVPGGSRGGFEATGWREQGPDLHMFEQGARDRAAGGWADSFPMAYWESLAGSGTGGLVGKDLGAESASLEALRRARDTGQPAMTASIQLPAGRKGVHVYWAIYRSGVPRGTVAERREHLRGFVSAIFDVERLIELALGHMSPRELDVALFDEGAPAGDRALSSHPSSDLQEFPRPWVGQRLLEDHIRAGLRWTGTLDVGGRRWAVTFTSTAGYVAARASSDMWDILLLGLLTTGLVGGYLLLLMRRTDEVERQVAARTQELEQALTERTRAEAEARTQAAQLEAVRTVSLEAIREVNLSEVLKLVARLAGDLLRTGTSTVWLWDEAMKILLPRAWHGSEAWCRGAMLRLGEGVVGTVAARGQGLLINHYQTSIFALPVTRTTTVVAEPLLYRERLLGVLSVHSETPERPFTDEDRQILALFARQAAIAIHTAQLFDQVAAGREQARRLTQEVLSVQEKERRNLSRELHDEAGQALTTLVLNLRLIHADVPGDQASLRRRLREAGELAQATAEKIRLLARGLRPPALDTLGLNTSLKGLCQDIARRTGVSVRYTGVEISPLPDAVAICLYRILQEALTNVVKHAHADRVRVTLRREDKVAFLSVEDNGRGFDAWPLKSPRSGNGSRSLGLLGMQERLELVGGHLEIVSRPGGGTRLTAQIPGLEAHPDPKEAFVSV